LRWMPEADRVGGSYSVDRRKSRASLRTARMPDRLWPKLARRGPCRPASSRAQAAAGVRRINYPNKERLLSFHLDVSQPHRAATDFRCITCHLLSSATSRFGERKSSSCLAAASSASASANPSAAWVRKYLAIRRAWCGGSRYPCLHQFRTVSTPTPQSSAMNARVPGYS
jgi:hypothetical protein